MKIIAILDIGTNSIKFYLVKIEKNKTEIIIDTNNISRLGEGMQKTGNLSKEAINRNIEVLGDFIKEAKKHNADEIISVGTMCLRTANNSDEFIKKAKKELNLTIQVIDGEEEARLSYLAVLSTIENTNEDVIVFDTGGGSTEFIFGKGKELNKRFSLNIGAVRPTEEFLLSDPISEKELKETFSFVDDFFKKENLTGNANYLIGIGGTVTSMGAVMHKMEKYDPTVIQGSKLTLDEVNEQIKLYQSSTLNERKMIPGLQPKRADVILAGAIIVKNVMEIFNLSCLTISDRGLRHGLIYDKYQS